MKVNQIQAAEFKRNLYAVTVPAGVKSEDLTHPDAWMHVAGKLRKFDRIEVICEDGTWFAEFIVLASSKTWARVTELRHVDLTAEVAQAAVVPDELFVKWGSPQTKFRVIRRNDKAVLKDGFDTKADADAWIEKFNTAKAEAA